MSPRPHPLWELTVSRIKIFFREPSAVFWTFGFPLILTVALGIAFRNKPPEPVAAAVVRTGQGDAEALLSALQRAPGFEARLLDEPAARAALRTGKVSLLVVPAAAGVPRTYLYDPTRPESRLARLAVDDALQRAEGRRDPGAVAERKITEPGSRYIDFLIPGLLGMNLLGSGMWGIGYLIVELRTRKLLKRMLATPMKRRHFLASFVLMRMLFLLLELPVLVGFSWIFFDVGVNGSLWLFGALSSLGALSFAALGLLVASRAENTQTVSGLINLVQMPMWMGSGVFFSTARFPEAIQPLLKALPLTALNDALRAVMIDGAGARAIAPELAILAAWTALPALAALKLFRWR